MRVPPTPTRSLRLAAAAALVAATSLASAGVARAGAPAAAPAAPAAVRPPVGHRVDPWITERLSGTDPISLLVHGTDEAAALAAIRAAGLPVGARFPEYGVVATVGAPDAVRALAGDQRVRSLEGDRPLAYALDSSHVATRGQQAIDGLPTPAGTTSFDGTGVTVAVIDSGVDPAHPFFTLPDGSSKVVVNRKSVCGAGPSFADIFQPGTEGQLADACVVDAGPASTDDASAGGHGIHVNGIAAGVDDEATSDLDATVVKRLHGAAPGARLASFSAGAGISIQGATTAFYWIKQHHADPCGDGSCPPIKVVNNSYGPTGGGDFSTDNLYVQIQRDLVAAGVVVVWAAGNDGDQGGSGTPDDANATNPPAQDPTPGVIQVANYDDAATGSRQNGLDTSSSRGRVGFPATYPDISAPGANITSACKPELPICSTGIDPYDQGQYNTISGTSMAAPHVAGIVAQLFQAKPDATPAEIELALLDTAHHFGGSADDRANYPDVDTRFPASRTRTSFDKGHGLVDVVAALAALGTGIADPGVTSTGPVCAANAAFTDPRGDATQVLLPATAGVLPNEPSLDVLQGRLAHLASTFPLAEQGDLVLRLNVADMVEGAPVGATGRYFRFAFKVGTTTYTAVADQDVPPAGAPTIVASLSRLLATDAATGTTIMTSNPPAGAGPAVSQISARIDPVTELVEIRFSIAALNAVEAATPATAAKLTAASVLTGISVLAQRQENTVTPTADEASGPCPFTIGAIAADTPDVPAPVVPEVPFAALLPLLALALLGGGAVVTRRREPTA